MLLFRWLDGNFSDLSSDAIEAESDEYTKEIYKIQKTFNIRLKKMLGEREEKMRERSKKKRRKTEIQELLEGPDAAAVVKEDEEPDIVTPAAIAVCTQVQEEIQEFKVSGIQTLRNIISKSGQMYNVNVNLLKAAYKQFHWTRNLLAISL